MNRTVTRVAALAAGATAVLATSALMAPHAEAAGKSLHVVGRKVYDRGNLTPIDSTS